MFSSSSQLLHGSVNLLSSSSEIESGSSDPRSPPCTVYLYMRPVMGNDGKGGAGMGAKHWTLFFDWGYYSSSYDAVEKDGVLTPFSRAGEPQAPKGYNFQVKKVKANLRVTPHAVDELARKNKFNGRIYDLILTNCQCWAQELAKQLGFCLPTGQVEKYTDIAVTAATVLGVAGTALATALKNKS